MTFVSLVHHDLNFLVDHVNIKLSRIFDRCNFNKLSINPAWSEFLDISNGLIKAKPVLYMGSDRIICENSVKYLDLLIACNLTFTSHVIHVKTQLSQLAGISHRIKRYLNIRMAKNYYYIFVYSVKIYCLYA